MIFMVDHSQESCACYSTPIRAIAAAGNFRIMQHVPEPRASHFVDGIDNHHEPLVRMLDCHIMNITEQPGYVLRGGESGAERLRLLASVKWPSTKTLLDRVGLRQGMSCLDVGCGIGAVTMKLAELVGPTGRVV